jgi:protein phosphatase
MRCSFVTLSETGLRARNEDSCYGDCENGLFIVADGLGGHDDGHIASALAVEVAASHLRQLFHSNKRNTTIGEDLRDGAMEAHRQLFDANRAQQKSDKMATTLTMVIIDNERAIFSHIGDCRLFVVNTSIEQLTIDHTVSAKLRSAGVPAPSIGAHLDSVLTQCLGLSNTPIPQLGEISVVAGDRLVICSDGFYREITSKMLLEYSVSSPSLETLRFCLLQKLKRNIPEDNATAIIVEMP